MDNVSIYVSVEAEGKQIIVHGSLDLLGILVETMGGVFPRARAGSRACPDCDGAGWYAVPSSQDPDLPERRQCEACLGTGFVRLAQRD